MRICSAPRGARNLLSSVAEIVVIFVNYGDSLHRKSSVKPPPSKLKALRNARGFERMRNIFAGLFATEARCRKNLCGVRKLQRVESTADALHRGEVRLGKHFGHHGLFLFADAVFSSYGTSSGDAKFQNLERKRESGLFLSWNAAVIENE